MYLPAESARSGYGGYIPVRAITQFVVDRLVSYVEARDIERIQHARDVEGIAELEACYSSYVLIAHMNETLQIPAADQSTH